MTCPFALDMEGWCHFSVRLERTKLHKQLKGAALGYEDEKFTYLIAGRRPLAGAQARIIGYPRIGKVIGLSLCKSDGALENAQIAKRDERYKAAKKSRWGDVF
jgi:ribosomal protein RSM22 (predicted rRNA methylase)